MSSCLIPWKSLSCPYRGKQTLCPALQVTVHCTWPWIRLAALQHRPAIPADRLGALPGTPITRAYLATNLRNEASVTNKRCSALRIIRFHPNRANAIQLSTHLGISMRDDSSLRAPGFSSCVARLPKLFLPHTVLPLQSSPSATTLGN